ncbi:MAG: Smr/MutS family protein [Proteobacteria bacterium]|nr:Smr/MutS family protein [Pseudomonadota bacterium]MDA1132087.1 Smr/MutS family protein [Pseudomonadota bacterium]
MTGSRKPTGDELRLWREAMGQTPLPDPSSDPLPDGPEDGSGSRPPTPNSSASLPAASPPAAGPPGGIGKHEARAIRRRRQPVADRIDLHGMTQAEAHAAVRAFLLDRAARGMKCVLVITGKNSRDSQGRRDTGAPSVLRRALPGWLESPDLAPVVIGSDPALPRDGGGGARYVLLRRSRS